MPHARRLGATAQRAAGQPRWSAVLRALREARGITQDGWAAQLGFGRTTIQRWERGDTVPDAAAEEAIIALCREQGLFRAFDQGPLRGQTLTPEVLRDLLAETRLQATREAPSPAAAPAGAAVPAPDDVATGYATAAPSGTVTFLFTDIEGSTALWDQYPEAMRGALARHDTILRDTVAAHGGHIFKTVGDAICAAFGSAADAVACAVAAQRALAEGVGSREWGVAKTDPSPTPHSLLPTPLRVRMAVHTGAVEARDGDYFGPPLNRIARLLAAAHGGQTLLSSAAHQLVQDALPAAVQLRDLGEHRLRGLERPERVYQLLHPDLPADFPPLRVDAGHATNLPQPLTSFVGRERELSDMARLLSATRLLTLSGAGGCGKTRLALQLAARVPEQYPDGVWLVELATVTDPALVLQTVAAVLGVRDAPGRALVETVMEYLRDRQTLLVLDNCEHLVAACAHVAETLLRACPALRILTTSREPTGITGETTYRVPSLTLPRADSREDDAAALTQYEAIRLFVDRAGAVLPGFALAEGNAAAVTQVCRRLDGIPLAIELAAARVNVLAPEQLAARLDDRFRLLTSGSRTALPRQQTLQALIDWSYNLLSEPERVLLGRLAVFAGGWTLEAAEAVCGNSNEQRATSNEQRTESPLVARCSLLVARDDVLDLLAALVNKSLVAAEAAPGGATRYRLLETVRQYSHDNLVRAGTAERMHARHRDWYLALAESVRSAAAGPRQAAWFDRLEAEHDNLRAALSWSLAAAQPEAALRLAAMLQAFWQVRGYLSEGRRWLELALAAKGTVPAAVRATALGGAGYLARDQADYAAARALFEDSLAIWRALGDQQGVADALQDLGQVAYFQGDFEAARALSEESLAICRERGTKRGIASALTNLGTIAAGQGDYAAAQPLLEDGLGIYRELGDPRPLINPLIALGNVNLHQGDHTAARARYEESLALCREMGDKRSIAYALANLGNVAATQVDYPAATAFYTEGLALCREVGDREGVAMSLTNLGYIAANQGSYAEARAYGEESLAIFRALGDRRSIVYTLVNLGAVAAHQADYAAAHALFEESLMRAQELGDREGIAFALEGLAGVAGAWSDPERAGRLFGAAEALREAIGAPLSPADRAEYDRSVGALRALLSEAAFALAWSEGRAMSPARAVAYAFGRAGGEGGDPDPSQRERRIAH